MTDQFFLRAAQCLERNADVPETKMAAVLRQIDLVTRFVGYQRAYSTKSGTETAIEGCRSLLQEQDINSAVRKGDIYGFLIEHYSKVQNYRYSMYVNTPTNKHSTRVKGQDLVA